jgi:hypothetical protein
VRIVEHRPFARWGRDRLLSQHGQLFPSQGAGIPNGLPLLDGPDSRVADVVALYNESRALFAPGGIDVRAVALDPRGSWSLQLSNGTDVIVGSSEARLRVTRFARLLPQLLSQKQLPLRRRRPSLHQWFCAELAVDHADAAHSTAIAGKDMNRKGDKALIVGLDIGTSKVVALVGEYSPGNPIEVIGIGSHEVARPQARRGGRHRVDGAVDPARGRGSRADGRLRDRSCMPRSPATTCNAATRRASCRSATASDRGRPRPRARSGEGRRHSRPTRRSCTRSRANTCSTIRRKASATRSA